MRQRGGFAVTRGRGDCDLRAAVALMAICIPETLPESMDHNSEALLMAAFQRRLGDDFLIMHSFPWLFPGREDIDAPAREGEADFVLLHRDKGMLVIEAKGGVVVLRDRRWRRVLEDGR